MSETARRFYRREGYVLVEQALTPGQLSALRRMVDRLVAGAAGLTEHDAVYDLEDSHQPDRPRVRRIKTPHRVDPLFMNLVRSDELSGPVADLIGPDLRLKSSKVNLKAAGYGAAVEWHQDWAFYPHTNDDILAVGVFLDDVDAENGPLLVLPGSHRGPVYDHHADGVFCGAIDAAAAGLDISGAKRITGPAGSISLHHVRMVHGSALNTSGRPRRMLFYEICAADAWPLVGLPGDPQGFEELLIRGKQTRCPRMVAAPVRVPVPAPEGGAGSIYEYQRGRAGRAFQTLA